jgi:hypothetical protein
VIFSLGIMLAVIVERFSRNNAFCIAGNCGAVGMNIALVVFHVLFINTPPNGFLITLGCLLIAFAYALSGLIRFRWAGMILSVSAIFLAITATWWLHLTMAVSITDLTPLFQYDYSWPLSQILLTSIIVALWMGIFGNLVRLNPKK